MAEQLKKKAPGRVESNAQREVPARASDKPMEEMVNVSLEDVLDLMAMQVERLETALEQARLTGNQAQIRSLIAQIDERHERLDQVKAMIMASRGTQEH